MQYFNNSSHTYSLRKIPSGFTLTEVLIVIAIIVVLASISISGLTALKDRQSNSQTMVLIASLGNALDRYKADNGEFPDGDGSVRSSKVLYQSLYGDFDEDDETDTGETAYLKILDPNLKGARQVVSKELNYSVLDAWRRPIYYQSPGQMNPSGDFDLWSLGKDGKGGPERRGKETKDDHNNW